MATRIEWTDATWNPTTGCTHEGPGCDNCYAKTMTHRLESMGHSKYAGLTVLNKAGDRHFNGVLKTHDDALELPLTWKKPRMVFVNSMSDLFHKSVSFDFIDKVFAVMALCPQHTFQILTKRPERMAEYLNAVEMQNRDASVYNATLDMTSAFGPSMPDWKWPLPNVWLGCSPVNQEKYDQYIPHLLKVSAATPFLSLEPLLGPINLNLDHEVLTDLMDADPNRDPRNRGRYPFPGLRGHAITRRRHWLKWVIVGGESGPGARPCKVEWIRDIIKQCKAAGVPCFVKQLGSHPIDGSGYSRLPLKDKKGGDMSEWPRDLRVREMPAAAAEVLR